MKFETAGDAPGGWIVGCAAGVVAVPAGLAGCGAVGAVTDGQARVADLKEEREECLFRGGKPRSRWNRTRR